MSGKKSVKSRRLSKSEIDAEHNQLLADIERLKIDVKHCEDNGWTDTAAHKKVKRLLAVLEEKYNGTSIK